MGRSWGARRSVRATADEVAALACNFQSGRDILPYGFVIISAGGKVVSLHRSGLQPAQNTWLLSAVLGRRPYQGVDNGAEFSATAFTVSMIHVSAITAYIKTEMDEVSS